MPGLKKLGKVWYAYYYIGKGDTRKKKWLPLSPSKTEADIKFGDLAKKLEAQRYGHRNVEISWRTFAEEYRHYSQSEKATKSQDNDARAVRNFTRLLLPGAITSLSAGSLERFKQLRKEEGVSDSTINRELDTLKSMGRKAQEWGYLVTNPFAAVRKKPLPKLLPRGFTEAEVARIRDAAYDDFEKLVIELGYYTGLRRGEMANLTWENIDWRNKTIKILKNTNWITKERKEKVIPMDRRLEKALRIARNRSESPFILNLQGSQVRSDYLTHNFERICNRAGVTGSLHSLRHTFCTRLAENNVNLKKIADLAGHASVTTTARYTSSSIRALRDDLHASL